MRAHSSSVRLLGARLQSEHGLTVNDYEALYVLSRADGGRMKRVDIARRLLLTPSGVTRLLEGLEAADLVERVACAEDLRVSYAQLTEAGREKLLAASCAHEGSVRSLIEEHLDAGEIEALAEMLEKLPGVAEGDDACPAA